MLLSDRDTFFDIDGERLLSYLEGRQSVADYRPVRTERATLVTWSAGGCVCMGV